jgi:uncharacterized protein with GYD domain
MARYLLKVQYTLQGIQGVRKEGASGRRQAAKQLVESAGGKLESFDFAFGAVDVYALADFPSHAQAANAATAVSAAGGATVETVVLISDAEVDEAVKGSVEYRPPGQ